MSDTSNVKKNVIITLILAATSYAIYNLGRYHGQQQMKNRLENTVKSGDIVKFKKLLDDQEIIDSLAGGERVKDLVGCVIKHGNPEMLRMLLGNKTVIGLINNFLLSSLDRDNLPEAFSGLLNHEEFSDLFYGAAVTWVMVGVIKHGNPEMLDMLLDSKKISGSLDESAMIGLMQGAIEHDKPEMLKMFLDNKTVIDLFDCSLVAGFMQGAIEYDKPEILKMFLDNKAATNLLYTFQLIDLRQRAIKHDKPEILKMLLDSKKGSGSIDIFQAIDLFKYAIKHDRPAMLKILLSDKILTDTLTERHVNYVDNVMWYSIENNKPDMSKILAASEVYKDKGTVQQEDIDSFFNNLDRYTSSCCFNVLSDTNSSFGMEKNQEDSAKIPVEFANIFLHHQA